MSVSPTNHYEKSGADFFELVSSNTKYVKPDTDV